MTTYDNINLVKIHQQLAELVSLGSAPNPRADQLRAELAMHPLEDYARVLRALKDQHDKLKTEAAAVWGVYELAAQQIVPPMMIDAGIKTMNVEGAGRLQVSDMMTASIVDKDQGYEWLRENGLGDIITLTVNASTLKATLKDWIKKGHAPPPENMVKISAYQQAQVVRV